MTHIEAAGPRDPYNGYTCPPRARRKSINGVVANERGIIDPRSTTCSIVDWPAKGKRRPWLALERRRCTLKIQPTLG